MSADQVRAQQIAALCDQGFKTYQEGQFEQGLAAVKESVRRAQTEVGPEHPVTALSLSLLGALLRLSGDLESARPCMEQGLAIRRRILVPDHPDTAFSLKELGRLLEELKDLEGARHCYEESLAIYQKNFGLDHADTAHSLTQLGHVLFAMGDLQGARPYYDQAVTSYLNVLGLYHPNTASTLDALGILLEAGGDLYGAKGHFEQAMTIWFKILDPDHPHTARSITNMGYLLFRMGDLARSRSCHERALDIRRKTLGPTHQDTAQSLNNVGFMLGEMGDFSVARTYYEEAIAIWRSTLGPDHPETATGLNNLGSVLQAMGDHSEARSCYEQALAIFQKALGPDHPHLAMCFNNLGALLKSQGDLTGAVSYLKQGLAISQNALGPAHSQTAAGLQNLGVLLQLQGDLAGARSYLERALEVQQQVLGPEHPETATTLRSLAVLCVAQGQPAVALDLYQQANLFDDRLIGQIASVGSERQRLAFLHKMSHHRDWFLLLVSQHLVESTEAVQAAFDLVLKRKALGAEALAVQRDALLGGKFPTLQPALLRLAELRQQICRHSMAGPGPEGIHVHEDQLAEWSSEKEAVEAKLAREIPEMNLAKKLQQVDRRVVALALDEGVSLVEFVRFNVLDFKAVESRGEPRSQPARYLAFVLPAGQPDSVQMIDLGEAEPIDRMIADFRSSITGEAQSRPARNMVKQRPEPAVASRITTGSQLRAAVFDSLVPALAGCHRLLLAPDGDLTRLPFDVLPDADGRLLIDAYQISYLGTGRDVLRFRAETSGQPTDSLVVADPDFDLDMQSAAKQSAQPKTGFWSRLHGRQPETPLPLPALAEGAEVVGRCSRDFEPAKYHFDRLPGTRGEGERIAAMLGVHPWLEHTALKGSLKQKCRSPRILHLATHGFFLQDQLQDPNGEGLDLGLMGCQGPLSGPLPENPLLRAGLALAGANTWLKQGSLPADAEDGLLTAEDVSGMDLLATELVVLSACETGLGEVRTGEGVFGLQRAFVLAGAKTLVMSLWSVPDEPTRELMEDFYQRILSGQPRADALHAAQIALRSRYPDPFCWGAFICQGDPGPLQAHAARS